MFRNLFEAICGTCVQEDGATAQRGLARAELQDLFRDDFAAQAVMTRSRKVMRGAAMHMAA